MTDLVGVDRAGIIRAEGLEDSIGVVGVTNLAQVLEAKGQELELKM